MNTPFRRPAQLRPEQLELIDGDVNIEARLELAHATAQALVPLDDGVDEQTQLRIRAVIAEQGIDLIAESWVDTPETSLPGVLWRGYLLREWIRRFPDEVTLRIEALRSAGIDGAGVLSPREVKALWDEVFAGDFAGDFLDVVRQSARLTHHLSRVEPVWIDDDEHPLATDVTRRSTAMERTAQEFYDAGEKIMRQSR
ncbi:hypothetical protein [Arcanobacterium pinnipediorum]|uniref:Uncharacterized protein n=1 Tax=Arcanobacterium pinnipediorum TaxID=1503041 RepID=A0ABY5AHD1_9ACTO|nr:hypothetical protein [Arcanobacterium pinnipediorum]USR79594.1 hypothetical protein NG665_00950 [Arcanobacterium pinnipediorum]